MIDYDTNASTTSPPVRPCFPLEVLEEAQRDLLALPGVGMSILEISHRSKTFDDIIQGCEADMRTLAKIPSDYKILFLQGGASLQFSMVPMNLLPAGGSADYIVTGVWGQKAVKEAKKVGAVKIAGTHRGRQLQARAEAAGAEARPGRRLRPLHVQQHDLRDGVALAARHRRGAARVRHVVRHLQPPDRRREVRADLRRRAEEPRARRASRS